MPRYRTRSWRAFRPEVAAATSAPSPLPALRGRILGLDPGSRRTGFGIVEWDGPDCRHVVHGCIDVSGDALAGRLRRIHDAVSDLLARHAPQEIAVERVFVNRNADSAIKLGQARGAALSAVPHELPVFEYAPRAVKLAIVGGGAAEKAQVSHMVRHLLGLVGALQADAADALAVALCHAHSRTLRALADAAGASARATLRTVAR